MSEGIAAHRQGNIDQAMAHYAQALQARPNRALAAYNLGVALIDAGLGLTATPFLMRATLLRPASITFRYALLFSLIRSGRLERASRFVADSERRGLPSETTAYWRRWVADSEAGRDPVALDLASPGLAEATNELPDNAPDLPTVSAAQAMLRERFTQALQDYQAGRMEKLVADLEAPLTDDPDWGEGHHLRGLGWMALRRFDQAVRSLERASELLPGRAELWDHLGVACARLDDNAGVYHAFEQALALNPLRAETWNNAADSARSRGRPREAFQYALQALRLKPDLNEAKSYLLQAAHEIEGLKTARGERSTALASAIRIVKAGANSPEQSQAIASMLARIERYEPAVEILEQSLSRFGDRPPDLLGKLVFHQRHICDWRHWLERQSALIERIEHGEEPAVSPFAALAIPGLKPADLLKVARWRAAEYRSWIDRARELRPAPLKAPGSRPRIGYLSADFHEHATAYLTVSLFERHDREQFEWFAYSIGQNDHSPMRQRLMKAFEHFVDLGHLTHLEAAQRIRDDGIDLLVDLKGYTRDARAEILALRPSPLQITWLGFPGGLGAPFIDYLIADPIVAPPEQAVHYDEAIAYLPDAYAPVDDRRQIAARPTRIEAGLPELGFIFCCFNDPYKITPEIFECWCGLLKTVPDSHLWLYAKNDSVTENLQREAAVQDVAPDRLVFARRKPQAEHLARIALADIFLDTLPINAHTTASDALWMGVPVLTCMGETFASRVAASLLTASGLPELVTTNLDDYQARALWLASHPVELAAIKQRLAVARGSAAFFDTARFTRNLEAIYQRIWDRHAQGLPPAQLAPVQAGRRGN